MLKTAARLASNSNPPFQLLLRIAAIDYLRF
jgi:hypothetical protein